MTKKENEIFALFRKRMIQKKINQKDLSKKVGLGRTTLYRNFKGEYKMTFPTFLNICEVLDLDPVPTIKLKK